MFYVIFFFREKLYKMSKQPIGELSSNNHTGYGTKFTTSLNKERLSKTKEAMFRETKVAEKDVRFIVNKPLNKRRITKARIVQTAEPTKIRASKVVNLRKKNSEKEENPVEDKLLFKKKLSLEYDKLKISRYLMFNLNSENVFKYII